MALIENGCQEFPPRTEDRLKKEGVGEECWNSPWKRSKVMREK